jgi:glycosyltransferase involved in cell wall biosynthesis
VKVIAALRIQNEARWIQRVINSVLPLVSQVLIFDDHSSDQTPFLCASMPKTSVFDSPFHGLNESRDKNYLLEKCQEQKPDWIIWIDGDEVLGTASYPAITESLYSPKQCMSFKVLYLWDREDQVRTDGVYGDFRRQSMFRPISGAKFDGQAPGFHCGNVPKALWRSCLYPDVELLHLGYLWKADRIRKYEWYNRQDPNNKAEDGYKHIVVGDVFPATAKYRHGGPLTLARLPLVSQATGSETPGCR